MEFQKEAEQKQYDVIRQFIGCITVFLPVMSGGMAVGWTSPTEEILTKKRNELNFEEITMEEFSSICSTLFIGGFFACLCWSPINEKFGRKRAGYLIGTIMLVSWSGLIVTRNYMTLLICRFTLGFGFVGGLVVGLTYTNEITSDALKGPLSSFYSVFINIGILIVFICGYLCTYRILNVVCALVPVVFLIVFSRLPESPIYLMMENRESEAREALMWYRGSDEYKVSRDMIVIQTSRGHRTRANLKYVFSSRKTCWSLFVGVMLIAGQHLSGVTIMTSYTVGIFVNSGSSFSPYISMILVGVLQVIGSVSAGFNANRINQKYMLVFAYAFAAVSQLVLCGAFYMKRENYDFPLLDWLPLCSTICYTFIFTAAIGPIPGILFTRIFMPNLISLVMSMGQMAGFMTAFGMTKLFPTLMKNFGGSGTFCIIGMINFLMALFVAKCVEYKKPVLSLDSFIFNWRK